VNAPCACGHERGAVEVLGVVEVPLEVGEAARIEELGVRLRVLDHGDDARTVGARSDDHGPDH
jgi:hypothetical protein